MLYGRYWGALEPLRHLHFNVCYYAAIEHCIVQGLQRFEPGAGGEFKHLRGFDATRDAEHALDPRPALPRRGRRSTWAASAQHVAGEIEWLGDKTARKRDR